MPGERITRSESRRRALQAGESANRERVDEIMREVAEIRGDSMPGFKNAMTLEYRVPPEPVKLPPLDIEKSFRAIEAIIADLRASQGSRESSLAITKLQEAGMWLAQLVIVAGSAPR